MVKAVNYKMRKSFKNAIKKKIIIKNGLKLGNLKGVLHSTIR